MQNQLIYQDNSITIHIKEKPDADALALLSKTVWGSDGTLYQHGNTSALISNVPTPYFLHLRDGEKLIGIYCYSYREIHFKGIIYPAYYRRYLSIEPSVMGKGYGPLLTVEAKKHFTAKHNGPLIIYGYVDEHNSRSLKLSAKNEFHSVANFKTLIFSRFFPKEDAKVSLCTAEDQSSFRKKLKEQYANYSFFYPDSVDSDCYVYKVDNEVIAGVRVRKNLWIFKALEGISGKIILKLFPFLPLLNKVFHPKKHQFLVFDQVFCKPGGNKF